MPVLPLRPTTLAMALATLAVPRGGRPPATVDVDVTEGSSMAVAGSHDGKLLVLDLQGQAGQRVDGGVGVGDGVCRSP